jgi:hypothetical protein
MAGALPANSTPDLKTRGLPTFVAFGSPKTFGVHCMLPDERAADAGFRGV